MSSDPIAAVSWAGTAVTARWLAAYVPPEGGAVTRFAAAVEVAQEHSAPSLRGDLVEMPPRWSTGSCPTRCSAWSTRTYVHVFLPPERLSLFREAVARTG